MNTALGNDTWYLIRGRLTWKCSCNKIFRCKNQPLKSSQDNNSTILGEWCMLIKSMTTQTWSDEIGVTHLLVLCCVPVYSGLISLCIAEIWLYQSCWYLCSNKKDPNKVCHVVSVTHVVFHQRMFGLDYRWRSFLYDKWPLVARLRNITKITHFFPPVSFRRRPLLCAPTLSPQNKAKLTTKDYHQSWMSCKVRKCT